MLKNVIEVSHHIIKEHLQTGMTALDATIGNGHDTLLLAQRVGQSGQVYGFDLQEQAINATQTLLEKHHCQEQVRLFHDSHAKITKYLKADESIDLVIFNLGYLPKGDKSIITKPESTLPAIEASLSRLKPEGILLVAAYLGHPGGREEAQAIQDYLSQINQDKYSASHFEFLNQKHLPPKLFLVERRS
ncbi:MULTISPECIES: tRNA (mnm(5)s(2)U34)-methyltransferase [Aerococcus]|uniref:Methyltransferase domain-containing protein n=2 Tax=Aerococcus TaxID=1375 RepID=A0A178HI22_9LACT|nr:MULTISPECIES: class I SAM-dependent methyltransferase [Aerococcus]KAA9220089.1 methyltransferase domain-containing protein [Aerococcus loyolae]KAA9266387.1 methyltransferase domain-containing protein [Aerococcus loyolae]MCY3025115.1 methyltransferase domain-containing protein [Aerococcus loyolae]MCY3027228.1 methyltransferase domain-containing protein [Aerococcus loyolae]MCY3029206.1 methyltransferase domain-containing protein [Aerococcus loyolae]